MTRLQSRIAAIASPNVVELDLKRAAKFGRLNVERIPFRIDTRRDTPSYRILEELAVERMKARHVEGAGQ